MRGSRPQRELSLACEHGTSLLPREGPDVTRKSFLMVCVALSAILVPSISNAEVPEVPTCFGQPTTIVGSDRVDNLNGTEGADVIVGLGRADTINGLGGDDLICGNRNGYAGDEWLVGGEGNDQINGGEGDDSFGASDDGNDRLLGGPGEDHFFVDEGDDDIVGGEDKDWFIADDELGPMILDLTTGESFLRKQPGEPRRSYGVDTISQVENLSGTPFNDILIGNDLNNELTGDDGDDTLVGHGGHDRSILYGDDTFFGGSGNDRAVPGGGDETIRGGPGTDWISYIEGGYEHLGAGGVRVYLRRGIAKGLGTDRFAGIENVLGTRVHDILIGDSGANDISGLGGDDTLVGGGGNDWLRAGDGDPRDSLDGGRGTDRCKADRRDIVTRCEV
jgi:Ca2+-binding RTX toxin-like protein